MRILDGLLKNPWKESRAASRVALKATFGFLVCTVLVWANGAAWGMTAQEILDEVVKRNFLDSFRIVLTVKTSKAKKHISEHVLWLMGRSDKKESRFFVEFDEPKDSKGLRFLINMKTDAEPLAYMYLPATGRTLPMAVNDPSVDIGGTGLSMEDLQGFVPRGGETAVLEKEEKLDGRDCYVVRVTLPGGAGFRRLWITKEGFLVAKTQQEDPKGKVQRVFRVVEFFKTDKGTEFPREEEITIPDKGIEIKLRQEHAVFGVELPDEIMDPDKFGTYKWRN